MKLIHNYIMFFICLFTLSVYTGCKDDEEVLTAKKLEIDASQLTKELDFRSTTLTIPVTTNMRISEWSVNSDAKWVTAFQQADEIVLSVLDSEEKTKRIANIMVQSEVTGTKYTIRLTQYGINDVAFRYDEQITIASGIADASNGANFGIDKTYDGVKDPAITAKDGNHFHSPWGAGNTKFPFHITYTLRPKMVNGVEEYQQVDYFIYYPRNGNGNFKDGIVSVLPVGAEDVDGNYIQVGSFDFKGENGTIDGKMGLLTKGYKAQKVKFTIYNGSGDFVSCGEMEFFEKSNYRDMNDPLLNVFTDLSCTTVKEGVTDELIEVLSSETLKRIAYALKNNTYDEWEKDFRIHSYEAYSNVNYWAEQIQTKKYSDLDNPTGIYVKKDEEIMVLVGKIPEGQTVSLQCIWERWADDAKTYKQTSSSGDVYGLVEGVNMLKMKGPGQLFVMYNVAGEGLTQNPEPVKIHIPLGQGVVNGYFDLERHKTDAKYAELLSKATHKYFCVRGERIMFYFHRLKMMDAAPAEILSAINLWDDFIRWEQEMCGIEAYRKAGKYNNHMFAISPEGGYMWASDYQIGFIYTYLKNILLHDNVMAVEDNAWGPSHEIGHVHQYAINWPGSTESSNNLFSNYIIRRLGKYKSRGKGLNTLANSVWSDDRVWWNMGVANAQSEDTEIHMRMNWQLWIYYELCKGTEKTPTFWPVVFEIMRTKYRNVAESNPGARQMAFVKAVCEAAQEDLTDFFETWGFFKTTDATVAQYGNWKYVVTQQMIDETKTEIARYTKKAAPIQYIEDRKTSDFTSGDYRYKEVGDVGYYTQFTDNVQITKIPTYVQTSNKITVSNGEQAVAFEVRKQEKQGETIKMGRLLYFSNFFEFSVPRTISMSGCGIYAVQADGERILMTKQ